MNLHQPTASVTIDGNRRILSVGETDFGGFSACLSVRSLGEAQLLALTLTNKSGENSPIIDDPCTLAVNFETAAAVSYHTLHGDSCGGTAARRIRPDFRTSSSTTATVRFASASAGRGNGTAN